MRVVALLAGLVAAAPSQALELTAQGRVVDASGTPVTDTDQLTIQLYSTASGGTPLFTEVFSDYPFEGGLYSVVIGTEGGIDDAWFAGDVWLGITVGTGVEMDRQRLTAVPEAGVAHRIVDGSVQIGANAGATCPGDDGALRWASDTLEVCTSSGWVDALSGGYTDADAVSAVATADAYLANTSDTLTGDLTVTGDVAVGGIQPARGARLFPVLMELSRGGGGYVFTDPFGGVEVLDIADPTQDYTGTRIAWRAATGTMYLNIEGATVRCVLMNNEDDGVGFSFLTATDSGNGVSGIWGIGGQSTFLMRRDGWTAGGQLFATNAQYAILCM